MLEVCLLGTGAMMPLPGRRLAAMMLRLNGRQLLIDCGEGTQVAARASGWSLAKIDAVCITHFHADHVAGLPGLLLSMGTCGRTQPVRLIGPEGLEFVVRCLRVIAPELPFELTFEEICGEEYSAAFHGARLTGFRLKHIIPCYGYSIELDRPGRFDAQRARALGIPICYWRVLQRGERALVNGRTFTPDMVLGPARKGIKLVYCTDTSPTDGIVRHAREADLLICEGTYGEDGKTEKANQYGHMTFAQAALLALRADARALVLTHFSPSISDPEQYIGRAQSVFPASTAGHDNQRLDLRFQDG